MGRPDLGSGRLARFRAVCGERHRREPAREPYRPRQEGRARTTHGPVAVVAPTLTASFAGPRLTARVEALAWAALVITSVFHGGLTTANHLAQLIVPAVLSALVVFIAYARARRCAAAERAPLPIAIVIAARPAFTAPRALWL